MKSFEIMAGCYYLKKNGGWPRLVERIEGGRVLYIDYVGIGHCSIENFARWAGGALTLPEQRRFEDDLAKIEKLRHGAEAYVLGALIQALRVTSSKVF